VPERTEKPILFLEFMQDACQRGRRERSIRLEHARNVTGDSAFGKNTGWREYLDIPLKDWISGQARNERARKGATVKAIKVRPVDPPS
jgi:hypothetical protein